MTIINDELCALVKELKSDGWSITLIGEYLEQSKEVIKWILKN